MYAVSRPAVLAIAILAVAVIGDTARAEEPAAAPSPSASGPAGEIATDDLFEMIPATGRHLKIDRRTGRVSLCEESGGTWACRLVADDRLAYEEEIARLEAENDRLSARVRELEAGGAPDTDDEPWISPEDEKRLDEFFSFSDKALRRFDGMVQDLKRDLEGPEPL
jgi:hypothetical protein